MIDSSTLKNCLQGCDFPVGREEIVDQAERNGCPTDVVLDLRGMEMSTYQSLDDVRCHLGDIGACS